MTPLAEVVLAAGGTLSASLFAVRQIVVDALRWEERADQRAASEDAEERARAEKAARMADPTWRAAQRAKLATERKLCIEHKARLLAEYNAFLNKYDDDAIVCWNLMEDDDKELADLVEQEALLADP